MSRPLRKTGGGGQIIKYVDISLLNGKLRIRVMLPSAD